MWYFHNPQVVIFAFSLITLNFGDDETYTEVRDYIYYKYKMCLYVPTEREGREEHGGAGWSRSAARSTPHPAHIFPFVLTRHVR